LKVLSLPQRSQPSRNEAGELYLILNERVDPDQD